MVIYMCDVWVRRCTWDGVRVQNDLLNFSILCLKQQRLLDNQWAENQILFQHRKKEDNEWNRLIMIGRAEVTPVNFSMFSTLFRDFLPITTTQRLHNALETRPQIYCRLLSQRISMLPVTHHNSLSVKHAVYPFNHKLLLLYFKWLKDWLRSLMLLLYVFTLSASLSHCYESQEQINKLTSSDELIRFLWTWHTSRFWLGGRMSCSSFL